MEDSTWHTLLDVLGLGEGQLGPGEMALRAIAVYVVAILLITFGAQRFMGRNTAFDTILAIILGSVLSRAVTGNAPFLPTVAAGAVLVALHWVFAVLSFRFHAFSQFVKGRPVVLVEDGVVDWDAMRRSHLSRGDLDSAMYSQGGVTDAADVALARLERSGRISVLKRHRPREPRVVEVQVADGVQRVRIQLE